MFGVSEWFVGVVGCYFDSPQLQQATHLHTFEGGKQFPSTLCMGLWVIEGEHIFYLIVWSSSLTHTSRHNFGHI